MLLISRNWYTIELHGMCWWLSLTRHWQAPCSIQGLCDSQDSAPSSVIITMALKIWIPYWVLTHGNLLLSKIKKFHIYYKVNLSGIVGSKVPLLTCCTLYQAMERFNSSSCFSVGFNWLGTKQNIPNTLKNHLSPGFLVIFYISLLNHVSFSIISFLFIDHVFQMCSWNNKCWGSHHTF